MERPPGACPALGVKEVRFQCEVSDNSGEKQVSEVVRWGIGWES